MGRLLVQLKTTTIVILAIIGLTQTPVVQGEPEGYSQSECDLAPTELDIDYGYDYSQRAVEGALLFQDSSNDTNYDAESGTANVEAFVDSGRGGGAIAEFGGVGFDRTWTAPCTGVFTFTSTYDVEVDVDQNRNAGSFGNGVTKAEVYTRLSVYDSSTGFTIVEQENTTEWESLIPSLDDVRQDAVVNYLSAFINEVLGIPVGEFLATESGVERTTTDFEDQETKTDQTISVTFYAQEGTEYTLSQETEAAIVGVSIANGGASGTVSVDTEWHDAQIQAGGGPISDIGEVDDATLEVLSTEEDADFGYEFVVDGDVELSETDEVAADDEEELIDNDDGTVTVRGSTGDASGDAFQVTGEILEFEILDPDAGYELELDDVDVTEELTGGASDVDRSDDVDPTLFAIESTSDGPDFFYEFTVDGTVEPGETDDFAADDEEEIIDNGDGTVTVTGSTGDMAGDAFTVRGDIIGFRANVDESEFRLELDGEDVTEELLSEKRNSIVRSKCANERVELGLNLGVLLRASLS